VLANNSKVLLASEGGNNVMYLPIDKLMQNRPAAASASGNSNMQLDDQAIREVGNQVYDQLRRRQATSRETRQ
jgi:membrane protease subunit HflK